MVILIDSLIDYYNLKISLKIFFFNCMNYREGRDFLFVKKRREITRNNHKTRHYHCYNRQNNTLVNLIDSLIDYYYKSYLLNSSKILFSN